MIPIATALLLLAQAVSAGAGETGQPAAEQAPGDEPHGRHRTVQGWLVEDVAEGDGGTLVRMTRAASGWRLEYYAAFWHGNDGIIREVSAIGPGECGNAEQLDRHRTPAAADLRALFARTLSECDASPATVRTALRGLEPAYAQAHAWSEQEAAAMAAEAKRIADYGKVEDD